jgi:hypothetical protein
MAYLETDEGWKLVDYFDMAGPLAFRDLVMAVDLNEAKRDKSGQIRMKLESGFLFWELDFAGLDCSKNEPVTPVVIKPSLAINQDGKEVQKRLFSADKDYYEQPVPGNEVVIDFPSNDTIPSNHAQVFLHVRGYYEHIRNYQNPPERELLTDFLKPGTLSRFSFQKFTDAKARYSYTPNHQKTPDIERQQP